MLDVVAQDFNVSIQEVEIDEFLWVQAQPDLQSEFKASQCQPVRFCNNNK